MAIVDGESMGALIGRRGETLQAFQFITQLLVNRRLGHWTRVLLDIEGYRSRRERYLKDTALRAAEKAMRYRESIELDPMIPSERRIVHLTLAEPRVRDDALGRRGRQSPRDRRGRRPSTSRSTAGRPSDPSARQARAAAAAASAAAGGRGGRAAARRRSAAASATAAVAAAIADEPRG